MKFGNEHAAHSQFDVLVILRGTTLGLALTLGPTRRSLPRDETTIIGMSAGPDPEEPTSFELDVAPTVLGRIARGAERARVLRAQIEAARARHASVDVALGGIERDSTIGGGMLGGALAYRLFVFLLPLALFFVAGVGIYADTTDTPPSEVVADSGVTV